jgi:hypothetical protein
MAASRSIWPFHKTHTLLHQFIFLLYLPFHVYIEQVFRELTNTLFMPPNEEPGYKRIQN